MAKWSARITRFETECVCLKSAPLQPRRHPRAACPGPCARPDPDAEARLPIQAVVSAHACATQRDTCAAPSSVPLRLLRPSASRARSVSRGAAVAAAPRSRAGARRPATAMGRAAINAARHAFRRRTRVQVFRFQKTANFAGMGAIAARATSTSGAGASSKPVRRRPRCPSGVRREPRAFPTPDAASVPPTAALSPAGATPPGSTSARTVARSMPARTPLSTPGPLPITTSGSATAGLSTTPFSPSSHLRAETSPAVLFGPDSVVSSTFLAGRSVVLA